MGGIVHFEIPADDQERVKKFYQEALGWRMEAVPGMDYNMVPKNEIPGMGYFACFKDPEDNVMGLWENLPAEQSAQARE